MSNLAEKIQQELTSAVDADQLELPTLPEVALKIRDAAQDPDVSAPALARVIAEDPAIAVRMIKIANSPLYRASQTIVDLNLAVSRIGVESAANMAAAIAMRQLFQATMDIVDRKLRQVWKQAGEVAGISAVLAKSFTRLRADHAALAGLTHLIGVLPILSWVEDHPNLLCDSMTLDRVIDAAHPAIGTIILRSWGFPEDVARVPALYTNFERQSDTADYVDVVMVANLQTLVGTRHPFTELDWTNIQAFGNLGLDPITESSEIEGYEEDLAAAKEAFAV